MTKYQNYSHYKLPITMEPLKYGKLIERFGNKYIISLSTPTNIAVINQIDNENFVKIFRKGDLLFEFKDFKISDIKFIRTIQDQKFTFEKGKLISTELLTLNSSIIIYRDSDALLTNPFFKNEENIPLLSFLLKKIKDPVKAFLIWEFCLILFFYIIFGILPDLFINNELEIITLSTANIIKLRKNKITRLSNWINYTIKISPSIFSKNLIKINLNKFWNNIVEKELKDDQHIIFLFRIQWSDLLFF